MGAFLNVISVVFWGLVMLSLIIVVHEGGHFTAAKLFGLRVKEFMIGLPGPNIGFKLKGTKFGVTPFLLGGYALIAGMQPAPKGGGQTLVRSLTELAESGSLDTAAIQKREKLLGYDLEGDLDQLFDWGTIERKKRKDGLYLYELPATDGYQRGQSRSYPDPQGFLAAERQQTFAGAPWYKRFIILLGGPAFNLIFAIIVFTLAMTIVGGSVATTTVASTQDGSPAASAGVAPGDQLMAINGQTVDSWDTFSTLVLAQQPGDTVTLSVLHDGQPTDYQVTLADNEGNAFMGISPTANKVPISLPSAFTSSVGFIGYVAVAISQLFNPATFTTVISQSTSVVGISFVARDAADSGFLPFIMLAAALSISIGLMNLLPLPPLDGGKIVLETIQRLARREIPVRVISTISIVVMVALGLLFIVLTRQDIQNFIFGG